MSSKPVLAAAVVALVAVLAATALAAEPTREERAMGLIEALTSGDPERAVGYLEANLTPDKWAERPAADWTRIFTMLARDMKDAKAVGINEEDDGRMEIVLETTRGMVHVGFDFVPEAPHRIAGLTFDLRPGGDAHPRGPRLPPPDLSPGMSREEMVAALTAWFGQLAEEDLFSGTALVALDGKAIFTTAHGYASLRFQIPNTMETRFDIGSINKDFTKIAIGQLHLKGKLKLADTIADHLPDYPNPEVAGKVTIASLLDHTSGLGDIFNEAFFRSSKSLYRKPQDYFPLFAAGPLLFEPGTEMRYSNAGYMVLGAIIESASGMIYDDYVEEHVFKPAGMDRTGFFPRDEPVPDVAIGYTRQGVEGTRERLRNNLLMLPIKGSPAGSAYATAGDLLRFDNALRDHELLPPAYTRWVFGGPEPDPETADEGSTERLDVAAGLAGGAPGVSALLEIDGPLVIVVLSNYDAPIAETVGQALMRPLKKALE
jgi:CubicO group peptidase (beta-lactamase class C family)